ncbi:MAG: hypothetical protein GXP22_01055 [Gammaproteobacteria bacterium]|nr:hypothetical protein [Gammaproteobacteria bacterium]
MKPTINTISHWLLWGLVMSLITACSYHLRGKVDLSERINDIYIQAADQRAPMVLGLRSILQRNGVRVVTDRAQARVIFNLLSDQVDQRVPVLSRLGKALEYELRYQFRFSLLDADGEVLLEPQTVSVNQEYIFDKNNIMAKKDEEQGLIAAMRDDLLRLIMLRLGAL